MDDELAPYTALFPHDDLADPVAARRGLRTLAEASEVPTPPGMQVSDPTPFGTTGIPLRIYRPGPGSAAVVWFHGGGFVMGDIVTEHPWAMRIADAAGVVVISVGYRVAPEAPYPAAVEDARRALRWVVDNSDDLGLDPAAVAVGGHAAGANLAASVALWARDEDGPAIRFQLLNQPALDDRQSTWSARTFTDTVFMTRAKVANSWRHYLGGAPASPYAAPARAGDLSGLPPAYIATAEFDPNRDEAIEYGMRLLRAGVPVELHQWAGTFHGSQAVTTAGVSQRQAEELAGALRRGLGVAGSSAGSSAAADEVPA